MNSSLRILLAAAVSLASIPAQCTNCTDNQFPLHLVNSQGIPAPLVGGEAHFATDAVYLAFDPAVPTGIYYVHVTDPQGGPDEVLSLNDPLDRFVQVTNNGGVITLSSPTAWVNPPVFGLGLNGIGQSILLTFRSSLLEPCRFKAWYGDSPDLTFGPANPYLLLGGCNTLTTQCRVRSYTPFTTGTCQHATCDGHTIGFWRNNHGKALVTQLGILAVLPGLNLANAAGPYVPGTLAEWASWLQGANSTNMAYMLSAQLAAMYCNVAAGFVDAQCVVNGGSLGTLTIQSLMQQAIISLGAHPYTPVGSPFRAEQEALKNALDAANNNQNWL